MDRAEKYLLILKAKFHEDEDVLNVIDAMVQLKRPEVLMNHNEKVHYEEYAEEWYNKGWIIWTGPKRNEEEVD